MWRNYESQVPREQSRHEIWELLSLTQTNSPQNDGRNWSHGPCTSRNGSDYELKNPQIIRKRRSAGYAKVLKLTEGVCLVDVVEVSRQ